MSENRSQNAVGHPDPGTDPGSETAGSPAASVAVPENAVVRRTRDGWRVGGADVPDLTCAMVLADLLAAETSTDGQPPPSQESAEASQESAAASQESAAASETSKLRATVRQLEHALSARVRVEQAIGVLAERHRIQPRQAFEQLRTAARNRGRRVIDIAADVVASATNPLLQLPDELSRPRSRGRAMQPQSALDGD
jgi:ANTAR domain